MAKIASYRLIAFIPLFLIFKLFASNIGVPPIYHFTKKEFKASPQNWDIKQDKEGIVYFANNSGLLVFDGKFWKSYQIDNQTIIRSILIKGDKIYVGAQGAFGYFKKNIFGKLDYSSLNHLIPDSLQNFSDVWDIVDLNNVIYFRSNQRVFQLSNNQIELVYQSKQLSFIGAVNNQLLIHDVNKGFYYLDKGILKTYVKTGFLKSMNITDVYSRNDNSTLFISLQNGILELKNGKLQKWQDLKNKEIHEKSIYDFVDLKNGRFALGTSGAGIFIIDEKGKLLYHINRLNGLNTNNVLSLFLDQSDDLWVGLNFGIDMIELSSPVSYIFPSSDLLTTGYSVNIHQGYIYFGTSAGLYAKEWKNYYDPLSNSGYKNIQGGQVWDILNFNKDLLLNHHEGIFEVKGFNCKKIDSKNGAWMQVNLDANTLISGHYNGLSLLKKDYSWRERINYDEIWNESSRFIVTDEDKNIWISHPYRGVFKVALNKNYQNVTSIDTFGQRQGLPSDLQNYVFKLQNEVVVCGEKGIYSYENSKGKFVPSERWNNIFSQENRVKKLVEGQDGKIWFVTDEQIGYLDSDENGTFSSKSAVILPFLQNLLVSSFEKIFPYDDENVFISHETGFIHYNPKIDEIATDFKVYLRQAWIDNGLEIPIRSSKSNFEKISYQDNSLHFKFSSNSYSSLENQEFRYNMEGLSDHWSEWQSSATAEFMNLDEGKYNFKIQARNLRKEKSEVSNYYFEILPPWYRTTFAYVIYTLSLLSALYALVFFPKKQYEKEKFALQSDHETKEQLRKDQILQLEKDKLELQILAKDQENLKLKEEKLMAELSSLKDQISPHFFFNTLNTLSSIIRKESKENSLDFVQNISEVYRYLLDSESRDLVKIEDELQFLNAYLHLLKKRFGERLNVAIDVDEPYLQMRIVSMALQILLENVVKHNKISKNSHVKVSIYTENDQLVVENNVNKKKVFNSHKMGLSNLKRRYVLLTNEEVKINDQEDVFRVNLPIVE